MDAGDSLSRYEVFVTEVTEGNQRKRQAMQYNVSTTKTSFLFNDKPFTLYEVSVDGVLDVNGEIGRVLALADTTIFYTVPVESVVANAVNATAVRVTWRALDLELSYYTVLYSAVGGTGTEKSATFPANSTSVVVGELAPGVEYMFQVVAVAEVSGSIMEGERSAVATATTFGGTLYVNSVKTNSVWSHTCVTSHCGTAEISSL